MLRLIIEDDEGRKTVVPFVRDEITIGRQEGNTIRLTERNVSRRHARLLRSNGSVTVEDLGSYNGIRINGERIHGQVKIQDGDLIQIGDYDLAIQHEVAQAQAAPAAASATQTTVTEPAAEQLTQIEPVPQPEELAAPAPAPAEPKDEVARRLSTAIIRVDQVEERERAVLDLDPAEAPRLVALNTEIAGREFACIRTELRVGRADDNDIAIDHRSLSRTHAKIVREDEGEWRVLDMQSANGLKVNDEPYAQATLRSGDIVELGHVRLRFVGPGESFTFVPDPDGGAPARSRGQLWALMALLLLAAASAGVYVTYFREPPVTPPEPPRVVTPSPGTQPPGTPPPVQEAQPEEKIAAAKLAISERDFDRAEDTLESALLPDGSLHPDAKVLLAQLKNEEPNKRALDRAEKAIAAGNLDEAERALKEAARTQLLSGALASLKDQLAKSRLSAPKAPPEASEADRLYDEAVAFARSRQLPEARRSLERCIKLSPRHAACHKVLGGVFARLANEEPDERAKDKLNRLGLTHYKRFLQLAPNDPDAAKVRRYVTDYGG